MKIFLFMLLIAVIFSKKTSKKDEYFKKLKKWFLESGGTSIPLRLKKESSSNRYLVPKKRIMPNDEIMFVPEHLIISYSLPDIKSLCDTVFRQDKVIRLECIAYYVFLHINDMSHFFAPYFDYMVFDFEEYPMNYKEDDLKKLNNTNMILRTQRQNHRVSEAFNEIMRHQNDGTLDFELYKNCFIFAMSRSFQKKMKDVPLSALVPMMELYNFLPGKINTHWDFIEARNGFVLKARKVIEPDEEIIVNYGRETNEDLLFKYGFTLKDNMYKAFIDVVIESEKGKTLARLQSQNLELVDVIMSMKGGNESKLSSQLEKLKELLEILNEKTSKYPEESEMDSYEKTIRNENIIRIIKDEQYATKQFINLIKRFITNLENEDYEDIKRMQVRGMSSRYCKILLEIIDREPLKEVKTDL